MGCRQDHPELESCPQCELEPFVRNHFFTGKMMGAGEFAAETLYHSAKMRHHNARLHGWGVVCGLKVKQHPSEQCRDRYVVVEPGSALDCCGHEILLAQEEILDIREHPRVKEHVDDQRLHTLQVCVRLRECPTEQVPVLYDECGCDDEQCAPNRILESFELDVLVDPPLAGVELAGAAALGAFAATDQHGVAGFARAGAAGKIALVDPGTEARIFVLDPAHRSMATIAPGTAVRAAALSADGSFVFAAVVSPAAACRVRIYKVADGLEVVPDPADAAHFDIPGSDPASVLYAAASAAGLLVYVQASGKLFRWAPDADEGLQPAAPTEFTLEAGLTGFVANATGTAAYGITPPDSSGNCTVKQFTLGTTVDVAEITATAKPEALAAFELGAPPKPMLAIASREERRAYLVDLDAPSATPAVQVDLEHPPAFVGAVGGADDVWLHAFEEQAGEAYVQAVSLAPLAGAGGTPLAAAARHVGRGARHIVALLPRGQAGTLAATRLADSDCADHLWKQLLGCMDCETPDCVVLATIPNYQRGMKLADLPAAANDIANRIARIDNRLGRRMLASTATLQSWLECLQLKGGVPGPKGDPGDRGADGTDGADGERGADGPPGPGLESDLTNIVATSWIHAHAHPPGDSPLVPVVMKIRLATGEVEIRRDDCLVIGFSGTVKGPDPAKLPYPYPVVMEVMIRVPDAAASTYAWHSLASYMLPVTSFTRAGDRITGATIMLTSTGGFPTQGPGFAFYLFKGHHQAMRSSDIVLVKLRGDFVVDLAGRAIDAEFVRAQFPTGDGPPGTGLGLQGGTFESWFGFGTEDTTPAGVRTAAVPINTARAVDLALVPGISVAAAEAIVAARERQPERRFRSLDEVRAAGGLGELAMDFVRPYLRIE